MSSLLYCTVRIRRAQAIRFRRAQATRFQRAQATPRPLIHVLHRAPLDPVTRAIPAIHTVYGQNPCMQ